jgi:hypothetical protein
MTMHALQTNPHSIPVVIAILVAVVGQAAILLNDFGPGNGSRRAGSPGMITAAAVSRAGATELPSVPPFRRAVVARNAS